MEVFHRHTLTVPGREGGRLHSTAVDEALTWCPATLGDAGVGSHPWGPVEAAGHAVEKGWRMIVFNFSGALRRGSLK